MIAYFSVIFFVSYTCSHLRVLRVETTDSHKRERKRKYLTSHSTFVRVDGATKSRFTTASGWDPGSTDLWCNGSWDHRRPNRRFRRVCSGFSHQPHELCICRMFYSRWVASLMVQRRISTPLYWSFGICLTPPWWGRTRTPLRRSKIVKKNHRGTVCDQALCSTWGVTSNKNCMRLFFRVH